MPKVLWTPVAESDLDSILFYLAFVDRNLAVGERIYFEIRDQVNEQAERGQVGHRHPEAPEGWLYFKHKRWLIFYQPLDDNRYATGLRIA